MTLKDQILEHFQFHGAMTQSAARQSMQRSRGSWDVRFRELVIEGKLAPVGVSKGRQTTIYAADELPAIDRFLHRPARTG